MKELYEKSLQEIRNIGGVLPRKRWNEIAMKKNLLSTESLKYISGIEYETLCLQVLEQEFSKSNKDK